MSRLASLPNELIDIVLHDLSLSDKHSLCLTCKNLNVAVAPTLYADITLEWSSVEPWVADGQRDKTPSIEALLRTLIRRPKLAASVKSLDFYVDRLVRDFDDDDSLMYDDSKVYIELSQDDQSLFRVAIESIGIPEPDTWMAALADKVNLHVIITLVIGVCTHLESLMICNEFLVGNEWFPLLVKHGLSPVAHGPQLFGDLSQAHITCNENVWPFGEFLMLTQATYLLLFYLPKVQILRLSGLSDFRRLRQYHNPWETVSPSTWPLGTPPIVSNLTILRLLRCSIHPEILSFIFKQTPNIHTFELSVLSPEERNACDMTAIRDAMYPVRNTLRDLTIRYAVAKEEEDAPVQDNIDVIDGSLGPLHDFPALTSLTVSLAVLFGRDDIQVGTQPELHDFLAPHLQCLTITDDLWMFSDFMQCFEDMFAMRIFKRFFTGEKLGGTWNGALDYENAIWESSGEEPGWKVATPELKEFVYDLREEGGQSHDYWSQKKYRNELRRAARGQGLRCKVLYG